MMTEQCIDNGPCSTLGVDYYANAIVETVREPLLILDSGLCIKCANKSFFSTFQTTFDEISGKHIFELGNGQWDIPELRRLLENVVRDKNSVEGFQVKHDFPSIGVKTMLLNARCFQSNEKADTDILVAIEDVTERVHAENELFNQKEMAQLTLRAIGDAVVTSDADGKVTYLNPVAEQLTGWKNDEARGADLDQVFRIVNEATREPLLVSKAYLVSRTTSAGLPSGALLLSRNGREYLIEDSTAPIRSRDGQVAGIVLVFRDVSEKEAMIKQISYQADHDHLTGLLNRQGFETAAKELLAECKTTHKKHALLFLDLDQFKIVNDTGGHPAGDELLRQLSSILQSKMRKADTLARLGGDEFGVLLHGCNEEEAHRIARFLVETVRNFRFVWQERLFSVGVSIGLVNINSEISSLSEVMNAADTACYMAKNKGRNRVEECLPHKANELGWHKEINWARRMHDAFDSDRLRLYFQRTSPVSPVTEPGSQPAAQYCEILLRLKDESDNIILPGVFLPAAERYGLMGRIDRWVVTTLCEVLASRGTDANASAPYCDQYAVNLSADSVGDPQFLDFVRAVLDRTGVAASRICFEITETTTIRNVGRAAPFFDSLRQLGCSFTLDDFGSGLSSFTYLKRYPFDRVKIDGNFVKDIARNPVDYAMVDAIERVCTEMHIKTIAVAVEDDAAMTALRGIGVDYAQGFALHRPEPFLNGRPA